MDNLIQSVLDDTNYAANPYFVSLKNGSLSKEDFIETQAQFYWAVAFFNRPMAALAAKIPSAELRLEILRNVWEEHGEGDPSQVHGKTFIEFLKRIGGPSLAELNQRALWPEIRAFNSILIGACVLDEYLIGAGALGMIERMFCDISSWIGRAVVARGWIAADHSQDFFNVLRPSWENERENRYYIEQGMRLGAEAFNNLYERLFAHRSQRLFRSVSGPHTRA
jgi:pyrroloquinoline-quinone synthase